MKLYVLTHHSGTYDDYWEKVLGIYSDQELLEKHRKEAQEEIDKEHLEQCNSHYQETHEKHMTITEGQNMVYKWKIVPLTKEKWEQNRKLFLEIRNSETFLSIWETNLNEKIES